jgi:hypothetical protein
MAAVGSWALGGYPPHEKLEAELTFPFCHPAAPGPARDSGEPVGPENEALGVDLDGTVVRPSALRLGF